jgi:DNA-binding XRE family transcriptional regulator
MNQLRVLRQAKGLAQQGLAVRSGVSPSTIVFIERWGYIPSKTTRIKIASALECEPEDIWPGVSHDNDKA